MRVLLITGIFISNFTWNDVHLVEKLTKQNSKHILGSLGSIGMFEEEVDDAESWCLQQAIEN